MQVLITKWGNSLGLRIPRALAQQTGIAVGQTVDISADGASLTITPAKPKWDINDLVKNMTPDGMRDAFDWGDDVGREIIDD